MSSVVYPPRWAIWIIRSVYWMFKIMGLATISLHTNPKDKQSLSFASSKFGIFYNVLFSCSLAALSYVALPNLIEIEYSNKTATTSTVFLVHATFGFVTMCTILLCYAFRSSTIERVCNYLVKLEERFRFSETSISLKRNSWNLLMVFTIQMTIGITALLLEHYAFNDGPLVWTTGFLPAAFVGNIFLQYFFVISLIRVNFSRVNHSIWKLSKNLKTNNCWNSTSRCRQIVHNTATVQIIRHLRDIHDDLCNVCGVISQFYSFPCLIVIAFTFYGLLFNSYYLLLPAILPDKDYDIPATLSTVSITVYLLYPFGVLASKITELLNEAEKTAIVVQSFLKTATNPEIKSELKQFSFQLLSRRVRFTVCGYFDLNNSLFQSMISTVVTYLVILIQYDVGNSPVSVCNCDCTRA